MSTPLSEFSHGTLVGQTDRSSRVTAGLLTIFLYALFALLVWRAFQLPSANPTRSEIVTAQLSAPQKKRVAERLPPILAHLVRPHPEQPAPPVFTIASGAPPQ